MRNYVYIYRDNVGKARYVGYGEKIIRATSHVSGSHNEALNKFLSAGKYNLEIAGPFENEEMARAVETALISAIKPDLNIDPGQTRWRFRPLGVPEKYAERLALPPLTKTDLCQHENIPQSVMLVKIGDKDFGDKRVVYDPANPPSDPQIRERFEKWWQVKRFAKSWSESPTESPRLLLAVTGKPGSQIIIGAVFIAQEQWLQAEQDGSLLKIPTQGPQNLDAQELRGRRIDGNAGIRFGSWTHQFFCILQPEIL